MIKKKTTIIVGAGASKDLGLPLGEDLKGEIAKFLYPKQLRRKRTPNSEPASPIYKYLSREHDSNWREEAITISENVMRAASIDNYLDNHKLNTGRVEIGKTAIARCIVEAERACPLSQNEFQISGKDAPTHFLQPFLQLVVRNHTIDDIEDSLKNITFVIFNYDRCVEHFMTLWLTSNFGVDMAEMIEKNVSFVHVYGALEDYFPNRNFPLGGREPDEGEAILNPHREYPKIIARLKIFSEQEESVTRHKINEQIQASANVIFLGFAFEEQNMKLFDRFSSKRVYATAFGFSEPDIHSINLELKAKFVGAAGSPKVFNGKCSGLFQEYSRELKSILGTI